MLACKGRILQSLDLWEALQWQQHGSSSFKGLYGKVAPCRLENSQSKASASHCMCTLPVVGFLNTCHIAGGITTPWPCLRVGASKWPKADVACRRLHAGLEVLRSLPSFLVHID